MNAERHAVNKASDETGTLETTCVPLAQQNSRAVLQLVLGGDKREILIACALVDSS